MARKSIAKVLNQKVARRPKCCSVFLLPLLQTGQFKLAQCFCDSFHTTKQQHFTLSSAPAHRFVHNFKASRGGLNWSPLSFIYAAIFFNYCTHAHKELSNEAQSLLQFAELEIRSVCMETGSCLFAFVNPR